MKTELINKISEKNNLTKKDSEKIINSFIETVTKALTSGNNVSFVGLGSFQVEPRAARKGITQKQARLFKSMLPM